MLTTIATTRTDDLLGDGERMAAALTDGYQLAFGIAAALVVAAIAVAFGVLRSATPAVVDGEDEREEAAVETAYSEAAVAAD